MHTKKIFSSSCSSMVSIFSLCGIVLFTFWNTQAAVLAQVPKGEHGAAEMEYQIKELNRLQPSVDVSKTPAGFDSVIWQAFIPQDNALTPDRKSVV